MHCLEALRESKASVRRFWSMAYSCKLGTDLPAGCVGVIMAATAAGTAADRTGVAGAVQCRR